MIISRLEHGLTLVSSFLLKTSQWKGKENLKWNVRRKRIKRKSWDPESAGFHYQWMQRLWIIMNTVLIIISVTGNVIPSVGECSPLAGFERLELSTEELALRKAQDGAFPASLCSITSIVPDGILSIFSGLLRQKAMFPLLPSFRNSFSLSH